MKENSILDFFIKLLPTGILLLALWLGNIATDASRILLTTTLGFSITIWFMLWKNSRTSTKILDNQNKLKELSLVPLVSFEEIEKQVKSLYSSENSVIYSTSINYRPKDISYSDSRSSDWAKQLYTKKGTKTQFNRIISTQEIEDKKWIKKMVSINKNPHYDIRIAQNVPRDFLYPNFIITKNSNDQYRLFISYRANSAGGQFAYFTQNKTLCKGIWDYATGFHKDLPKVDDCNLN